MNRRKDQQFVSNFTSGYFGFPSKSPFMVIDFSDIKMFIDVKNRRSASVQELPREMRQVLTGRDPSVVAIGGAVTTSPWLQLQDRVWKASGGMTGHNKYWVKLWDSRGQEVLEYSGKHRFRLSYVVLNYDGTIGASADELGEVHVWNALTGKQISVLTSNKSEIYRVQWNRRGDQLGFATVPHYTSGSYVANQRGTINKTLDLVHRQIRDGAPDDLYDVPTGNLRVTKIGATGDSLSGTVGNRRFNYRGGLDSITLTEDPNDGLAGKHYSWAVIGDSVAVGSHLGEVQVVGFAGSRSTEVRQKRKFIAHAPSLITSIAPSPDGEMLATSSTDGTIRVWSLKGMSDVGVFDFGVRGTQVLNVPRNGPGYRAGVRNTDEILSVEGVPYYEYHELSIASKVPPGGVARIKVRNRQGDRFSNPIRELNVKLVRGAEKVRPMLSAFIARSQATTDGGVEDNEWIVWAADGYYDASPGGDKYIGFHINQGKDKAALWYSAAQFDQQLYRPDVIDMTFRNRRTVRAADLQSGAVPVPPQEDLEKFAPPRLLMKSPVDGFVTRDAEVDLVASIVSQAGLPISDIRLTVNGRPVPVDEDSVDGIRSTDFRQRIRLDRGDNRIQVTAKNRRVSSETAFISVKYDVPAEPKRVEAEATQKLHVLAIGISKYEEALLNLDYAHQDAIDFVGAWEKQKGRLYSEVKVTKLTNEDATRVAILTAIDDLIENVKASDRVAILVSSHGCIDPRGNYRLLPHDVNPKQLTATGIPASDIQEMIESLLDRQCEALLFVDTCHSGGSVGSKGLSGKLKQNKKDPWRSLRETSCLVFTSSQPAQESQERSEWENGAFTEVLLEAMNFDPTVSHRTHDGRLSTDELQTILNERVPLITNKKQQPGIQRNANTVTYDIAIE